MCVCCIFFFFSSRRRHTRSLRDWSSDVCSSDLTYWARLQKGEEPTKLQFILFAVALASARWVPYVGLRIWTRMHEHRDEDADTFRRSPVWRFALGLAVATVPIAGAFALTAVLTRYLAINNLAPHLELDKLHGRIYASLAVPLFLILLTG